MRKILLFVLVFLLIPTSASSRTQSLQVKSEPLSIYYFEHAAYDCGRLLSLSINETQKGEVSDFYSSLFSNGGEILFIPMYHSFYKDGSDFKTPYSIKVSDFEDELSILTELQFMPVSVDMVYYYVKCGMKIPERAVLLTFDDCYNTFEEVYHLIKKYKFRGVLSIMTGYIDASWALSKGQIKEIEKDGLIQFASHTHTLHNNFRNALEKKQYLNIEEDIQRSREFFDEEHIKSYAFTYPQGKGTDDAKLRKILSNYGFKMGFTLWKEYHIKPRSDPFAVSRIEISKRNKNYSKEQFRRFLLEYLGQ